MNLTSVLQVVQWEQTLHIPEAELSRSSADLIRELCCGPDKRLGKNGADEIKRHSFFSTTDFTDLRRKR